jgi:hypothetical protein
MMVVKRRRRRVEHIYRELGSQLELLSGLARAAGRIREDPRCVVVFGDPVPKSATPERTLYPAG